MFCLVPKCVSTQHPHEDVPENALAVDEVKSGNAFDPKLVAHDAALIEQHGHRVPAPPNERGDDRAVFLAVDSDDFCELFPLQVLLILLMMLPKQLVKLKKKIRTLKTLPYRGSAGYLANESEQGFVTQPDWGQLRFINHRGYLIFYEIKEQEVIVLHITTPGQDWISLFF